MCMSGVGVDAIVDMTDVGDNDDDDDDDDDGDGEMDCYSPNRTWNP